MTGGKEEVGSGIQGKFGQARREEAAGWVDLGQVWDARKYLPLTQSLPWEVPYRIA